MLNIEPIRLKSGNHADTATTGSGCFMNVIAYLNGEPQITDESPCVCAVIRPIAVWLNDYLNDSERNRLIPFIHRAMGTATDDPVIMANRAQRVVVLADELALYADESARFAGYAAGAADSAAGAADSAAGAAGFARSAMSAGHAAMYAADCADCARHAAMYSARSTRFSTHAARMRGKIIDSAFRFLEDVCPPADVPTAILIDRANRLVQLATA